MRPPSISDGNDAFRAAVDWKPSEDELLLNMRAEDENVKLTVDSRKTFTSAD